jgi:hypothetical protein
VYWLGETPGSPVATRRGDAVRAGRFVKLAGGGWFRGVAKPRVVSRDRGKPPASHASRMALISAAICSSSLVRVLDVGMRSRESSVY